MKVYNNSIAIVNCATPGFVSLNIDNRILKSSKMSILSGSVLPGLVPIGLTQGQSTAWPVRAENPDSTKASLHPTSRSLDWANVHRQGRETQSGPSQTLARGHASSFKHPRRACADRICGQRRSEPLRVSRATKGTHPRESENPQPCLDGLQDRSQLRDCSSPTCFCSDLTS